jgi:phage-related protein
MKRIVAFKSYYRDFMASLSREEQLKIRRVLALFETENLIPHHYIKYVWDGTRIFFIYDGETMIVLFNCFVKKTQKTPKKEIEKANKLKREYEESK